MGKCLLSKSVWAFLFIILASTLSAEAPDRRPVIGVYGGWSSGSGDEFVWQQIGEDTYEEYCFNFNLGAYIQFNITRDFGLQLNWNYQDATYKTEWHPWFSDTVYPDQVKFGVYSLSLNGIYTYARWKSIELYLLGGGGLTWSSQGDFDGVHFNVNLGPGVKIYVSRSDVPLALNLSATFSSIFMYNEYEYNYTNSFRINLGLEY